MIRVLGAALVAAGCALLGFRRGEELKRRVRALEALQVGFEQMRRELTLRLTPLPRLMAGLARVAPAPAGELFGGCARALEHLECKPFPAAWTALCEKLPSLNDEDRRLLIPLGGVLGRCEAGEQAAAIAEACRVLEERCRAARQDSRSKGRVCRALGAAAGGFLAILLL